MLFYAYFVHIVYAKLVQADARNNDKSCPEWVRTSDMVIRAPARYHWTTVTALYGSAYDTTGIPIYKCRGELCVS